MLGSNDAWEFDEATYRSDYKDLIKVFQDMHSKPEIFIMIPPPTQLNVDGGCG